MKYICNLLPILLLSSCAYLKELGTPYRVNLGIATKSTEFKESKTNRIICVNDSPNGKDNQCPAGGFLSYKDYSELDYGYETKPYYFSDNFGLSFFLGYNSVGTTLLDYPFTTEKTSVRVSRWSVNPHVYYTWGDRYFFKNKGRNFRIGLGLAVNYVNGLELLRFNTGETIYADNEIMLGGSVLLEFNWNWFYFKISNSNLNVTAAQFTGVNEKNKLEINNIYCCRWCCLLFLKNRIGTINSGNHFSKMLSFLLFWTNSIRYYHSISLIFFFSFNHLGPYNETWKKNHH
jgi:hypothetical protein